MGFELLVVSHTPQTPVDDLDTVAARFLTDVGYLPQGGEAAQHVREAVPYRLFVECFLRRPEKAWTVDELAAHLATSRPTVYRHLNKLKGLDLLEESTARGEAGDANARKTYRLRYGNLSKAWNFVEANVKLAIENYRRTVDHLHDLAQREARERATGAAGKKAKGVP